MTKNFYADIFNHSGASYHRAMRLFPRARDEEFNTALSLLNLTNHSRLLDVPSGGGYLRDYLSPTIDYSGFDFSKGFTKKDDALQGSIAHCSEVHIPVEDSSFNATVCLAALHHVEKKLHFFSELHRSLKPNGILLIGDVVHGSNEAVFLNGFVNDWNSLGHNGDFLCFDHDAQQLQEVGFSTQTAVKHYHWNFASESDCHDYLRLLFSLDKSPSKQNLSAAINELGMKKTSTGFHLCWSLGFIIAMAL